MWRIITGYLVRKLSKIGQKQWKERVYRRNFGCTFVHRDVREVDIKNIESNIELSIHKLVFSRSNGDIWRIEKPSGAAQLPGGIRFIMLWNSPG